MYEGQPIICQNIIEENWLEYLAFVKKRAEEEMERQKRRQEALAEIEQTERNALSNVAEKAEVARDYHYYDLGISGFWNWYISHKI